MWSYTLLIGIHCPDDPKEISYQFSALSDFFFSPGVLYLVLGVNENQNAVKIVDIFRKIKSERLKIWKMSHEKQMVDGLGVINLEKQRLLED